MVVVTVGGSGGGDIHIAYLKRQKQSSSYIKLWFNLSFNLSFVRLFFPQFIFFFRCDLFFSLLLVFIIQRYSTLKASQTQCEIEKKCVKHHLKLLFLFCFLRSFVRSFFPFFSPLSLFLSISP